MMGVRVKFLPVLYAMIEPNLKLIVTCDADRESMVSNYIRVRFDPDIDVGRLTTEISDTEKRRWKNFNSATPPPKVSISKFCKRVTNIFYEINFRKGKLELTIRNKDLGFGPMHRVWKKIDMPGLDGYGYEILYSVLKAAIQVPRLDQEARSLQGKTDGRIALYIERPLADELAAKSSFVFDTSKADAVLVAERGVRS